MAKAPPSNSRSGAFVQRLLAARAAPLFRRTGIQALTQLVHQAQFLTLSEDQELHKPELGLWLVVRGGVRVRSGVSYGVSEEHDFPKRWKTTLISFALPFITSDKKYANKIWSVTKTTRALRITSKSPTRYLPDTLGFSAADCTHRCRS